MLNKNLNNTNTNTEFNFNINNNTNKTNTNTNTNTNIKTNTSLNSITPQLVHLVSKLNKQGMYSRTAQRAAKESSKLTTRLTKLKYTRVLKESDVKQISLSNLVHRYKLESKERIRANLIIASKLIQTTKEFEDDTYKSNKLQSIERKQNLRTIKYLKKYNPLLSPAVFVLDLNNKVQSPKHLNRNRVQKIISQLYRVYNYHSSNNRVKYLSFFKFKSELWQTAHKAKGVLSNLKLLTHNNPIYKNFINTKRLVKDSLTLPDNLKNKITYFNGYKTPISNWKPLLNWLESPIKNDKLLPIVCVNKNTGLYRLINSKKNKLDYSYSNFDLYEIGQFKKNIARTKPISLNQLLEKIRLAKIYENSP